MASLYSTLYPDATQTQEGRASSSTYYSNPDLVNQLSSALSGLQTNLASQYQGLLTNPTASPLFQGQLGPLLQSLVPSEDRARTSLTDTFRAAGGLRSGAYGRAATQLEGDILGQRQQAAGRLLGQAFPQLMQALQNPLGQVSSLIDALKLNQSQGALTSTGGGGGGYAGSFLSSPRFPSADQEIQDAYARWGGLQSALNPSGGGATVGVGGGYTPSTYSAPTDLYGSLGGGSGGGFGVTYNPYTGAYESAPASNLGTFTQAQGGPSPVAPTPEWNPLTGAYQGGYQPDPYSSYDVSGMGY